MIYGNTILTSQKNLASASKARKNSLVYDIILNMNFAINSLLSKTIVPAFWGLCNSISQASRIVTLSRVAFIALGLCLLYAAYQNRSLHKRINKLEKELSERPVPQPNDSELQAMQERINKLEKELRERPVPQPNDPQLPSMQEPINTPQDEEEEYHDALDIQEEQIPLAEADPVNSEPELPPVPDFRKKLIDEFPGTHISCALEGKTNTLAGHFLQILRIDEATVTFDETTKTYTLSSDSDIVITISSLSQSAWSRIHWGLKGFVTLILAVGPQAILSKSVEVRIEKESDGYKLIFNEKAVSMGENSLNYTAFLKSIKIWNDTTKDLEIEAEHNWGIGIPKKIPAPPELFLGAIYAGLSKAGLNNTDETT